MIPVTKPFMPPRKEYEQYLKGIWEREYLTNNGPLVQELEMKLAEHLGVGNLIYVSNGTVALQIAIEALDIFGDVITTPFSYVATTSSLIWEGCRPVFVDVDPYSLNIDPGKIEAAITKDTSAILATHVFGNPCDIGAIRKVANRYNLKVIYDASHCFGTEYNGQSVLNYGDVSTISFHATKLYHTTEGGAIVTNDDDISHRTARMRNFGHAGPGKFEGVGINGKNSEYHAAMGLCNLDRVDQILQRRKKQWLNYKFLLRNVDASGIKINKNASYNYAYYPAIFSDESLALEVKETLEESDIYPRRYFYPSLNKLDYTVDCRMPISENISKRILCLPLFHELTFAEQRMITDIISEFEMVEVA